MINRVVLIGRLTKDVEVKYTGSGTAVGSASIAVNRQFTNANGEREADFINLVIWRKTAENLAKFAKKGHMIAVEGRLQTRNYENNQGQRVYVTEVVVDNFSLLEKRGDNNAQNSGGNVDPFGSQNATQGQNSTSDAIDISDDDLPF